MQNIKQNIATHVSTSIKTQNVLFMKKIMSYLAALAFTFGLSSAHAQFARVQIIHNSPDLAADEVDVWVGNTLTLDNFAFRTATPYLPLPAGVPIEVRVKDKNSQDTANPLFFATLTLAANETYVVIANGIISTSGYSNSPAFGFDIFTTGRESSANAGETDLLLYHGSPDAPAVDVVEVSAPAGTVANDLAYGDFNPLGYLELINADYIVQVRDQTGTVTVREYAAPLQSLNLADSALVALASGFLNPAVNSNGPAFGVYVALPSGGTLIPLPLSTAKVQVVHNSADAAAASVDLYVQDAVGSVLAKLENVEFRTATAFLDLPSSLDNSLEISVGVAPENSTSPAQAIFNKSFNLSNGVNYTAIANGIVSATGYSPAEPFDIYVYANSRTEAQNSGEVDILVFHGATDAPAVDVFETNLNATIVDNLEYAEFDDYINITPADLSLMVQDSTGSLNVRRFFAPLATLNTADAALLVVASGFLNPAANSNGSSFGLYAITTAGGPFIELPMASGAVQVIHNSADLAASTVDVYIEGPAGETFAKIDDFNFRTATPFVNLPSDVDLTVHIAASNSSDFSNSIFQKPLFLTYDESYVAVANGIVSTSGYTPDASTRGFDIYIQTAALQASPANDTTSVLVFHGATDAPTVDVAETDVVNATIIDDLEYAEFRGYLNLPTADYILAVQDETGTTTVASYQAPLATLNLGGQAIVVLASGFLDPDDNSGGEEFGLWVALNTGGNLVELPLDFSTNTNALLLKDEETRVYPNPSSNNVWVQHVGSQAEMSIFNITGSLVRTVRINEGVNTLNVSDLPSGTYIYRIENSESTTTGKLAVTR